MPYPKGCLDLRGVPLPSTLFTAPTQKAARDQARARGWKLSDIYRAATRFDRFWICGQWVEYGRSLRVLSTLDQEIHVLILRPRTKGA